MPRYGARFAGVQGGMGGFGGPPRTAAGPSPAPQISNVASPTDTLAGSIGAAGNSWGPNVVGGLVKQAGNFGSLKKQKPKRMGGMGGPGPGPFGGAINNRPTDANMPQGPVMSTPDQPPVTQPPNLQQMVDNMRGTMGPGPAGGFVPPEMAQAGGNMGQAQERIKKMGGRFRGRMGGMGNVPTPRGNVPQTFPSPSAPTGGIMGGLAQRLRNVGQMYSGFGGF